MANFRQFLHLIFLVKEAPVVELYLTFLPNMPSSERRSVTLEIFPPVLLILRNESFKLFTLYALDTVEKTTEKFVLGWIVFRSARQRIGLQKS